jgi:hypothetical protein
MIGRRAGDVAAAALFALPLLSVWDEPALPVVTKVFALLIFAATAARPSLGLAIAAFCLPLAPPIATLTATPIGGAGLLQLMAMAVLSAGFARLAVSREAEPSALARPALLLAAVIAAGAFVHSVDELAYASWPEFGARLWAHITREFFSGAEVLGDLHRAAAWIEALGVAVFAERTLRADRAMAPAVRRAAIAGAAGLALFSVRRVAELEIASPDPLGTLLYVVRDYRFNPFYGDLNAAGSLQTIFLVPALWIAAVRRERWVWAAVVVIAFALWFSGSRAALLAAFAGAAVAWALARRLPKHWLVGAGVVALGAVAFTVWSVRPGRASIADAVTIRWGLATTGVRVAATDPVLGVGVDRLRRSSAPFIPAELAQRYPPAAAGDNAHNNFVQVLAESGAIGFVAFIWLIAAVIGPRSQWRSDSANDADRPGLVGGLAAFLLTCLAGHPLLHDGVRTCFFLMAGLTAAGAMPRARFGPVRWRSGLVVLVGLATVAAVLPSRITAARRAAHLDGVVLGAGPVVESPDGRRYRVSGRASSWFVGGRTTIVEMALRVQPDGTALCRVSIDVDGRPASVVDLDSDEWHPVRLVLTPGGAGLGSRRIDMSVATEGCTLLVSLIEAR